MTKTKLTGAWTSTPVPSVAKELQLPAPRWRTAGTTTINLPSQPERRLFVRFITIATLVLAVFLQTGCAIQNKDASGSLPGSATVVRVVDGDTVRLRIDGTEESVRLIGVDTPETVDPKRPVGCFGNEASDFTKSLLKPGTPVRVETDVEARDRYQRLLVYLYRSSDDLFVNAELAKKGYANILTVPPNVAHQQEFVALVAEARRQNLGLWGSCPAV